LLPGDLAFTILMTTPARMPRWRRSRECLSDSEPDRPSCSHHFVAHFVAAEEMVQRLLRDPKLKRWRPQ
jgi:hypothetical protein